MMKENGEQTFRNVIVSRVKQWIVKNIIETWWDCYLALNILISQMKASESQWVSWFQITE